MGPGKRVRDGGQEALGDSEAERAWASVVWQGAGGVVYPLLIPLPVHDDRASCIMAPKNAHARLLWNL